MKPSAARIFRVAHKHQAVAQQKQNNSIKK